MHSVPRGWPWLKSCIGQFLYTVYNVGAEGESRIATVSPPLVFEFDAMHGHKLALVGISANIDPRTCSSFHLVHYRAHICGHIWATFSVICRN